MWLYPGKIVEWLCSRRTAKVQVSSWMDLNLVGNFFVGRLGVLSGDQNGMGENLCQRRSTTRPTNTASSRLENRNHGQRDRTQARRGN